MIDYIDKIYINLKVSKDNIKHNLPLRKLKYHSARCHLDYASGEAQKFGYLSKIEIEQPEMEVFLLLAKHEEFMSGYKKPYKISHIEIARDAFCSSKRESIILRDFILKHRRVKYSTEHSVYEQKDSNELTISEIKYSDKTGYWGSKKAKLAMYPRISKKANVYCVHDEYRFWNASNIKKKTGISTLNDVINFNFEQFFKQQNKYITYESIDYEKLGRWVNNIPPRTSVIKTFGKEKIIVYNKAERAAYLFCRAEIIKTVAGLRMFFKKELKRIRTKVGRRTQWENKVLDLTPYRINTFFNPLDLIGGLI